MQVNLNGDKYRIIAKLQFGPLSLNLEAGSDHEYLMKDILCVIPREEYRGETLKLFEYHHIAQEISF